MKIDELDGGQMAYVQLVLTLYTLIAFIKNYDKINADYTSIINGLLGIHLEEEYITNPFSLRRERPQYLGGGNK